jgi:hypothetical protein
MGTWHSKICLIATIAWCVPAASLNAACDNASDPAYADGWLDSQVIITLGGPVGTPIDRIRIANCGTRSSADGSRELRRRTVTQPFPLGIFR